ncbi:DUF5050 domain-containing protein [Clostridium lundense]|uniref:DUF5050 domain-containing protein n=1 Tax=Clostridium lundense TaxID=319475 RepID=UPI0004855929|nr:DUF5050 domain-containing protein [Clostridium lundense]
MKKTKFLVATITSILLTSQSIAYAKLPNSSLIIDKNAFDINYVFDKEHVGEINKTINEKAINNIYYIDSSGKIKDIFSPTTVVEEKDLKHGEIEYRSYKHPQGIKYTLRGEEYSFFDRAQAKFKVSLGSIEKNKYIVSITYDNGFNKADNGSNDIIGKYLKFQDLDKIDLAGNRSFIIFTSDRKIPFSILDEKDREIGIGQIDLSKMNVGESADKICEIYKKEVKTELETSIGNVQNSGETMIEGDYIYYSNGTDNGKLYKMKKDGSENKVLSEDKVKYMCVIDHYIYYSNMSDDGKLYKIKDDGNDRKKLYDSSISYIDKSEEDLYFINISDRNKIYKIETSKGDNITKVSDDPADSLSAIGTGIYYTNKNDSNKLHKISTGTSSSKVVNLPVKNFIGKDISDMILCTTDGYVYRYEGGKLEKITLNVPNYSSTTKEDRAFNINVIGNYIYYKSINDEGKLYRVNKNGGNSELVVSSPVDSIYVVDSENFYVTQGTRMNKLNITMDPSGRMNFLVTPTSKENTKAVIRIITQLKNTTDNLKPLEEVLPKEVEVEFNDHTQGKLPAYWDTNRPQPSGDETIYTGTLLGGTRVQYRYSESTADVNGVSINIIRNFNRTYTLALSGGNIKPGDLVRIYTNNDPIAQQTADRDGKVIFRNLILTSNSIVSATRKENGKVESKNKVEIIGAMQKVPEIKSVNDFEDVFNGVDGRDITIQIDESSLNGFNSKEVYIFPKGRVADLTNSRGLKSYDLSQNDLWVKDIAKNDGTYTGTNKITTDSMGTPLNNGQYDIYLVGSNSTTGDKYCSDAKSVVLKLESQAAVMSPEVTGDGFKAANAIADVKAKLNVKALNGSIINDITTNYDVNVMFNGENLNKNNLNYEIENNNSVVLKKEFLNTLKCGTYNFEVVLKDKATSKEIKSIFKVVINSGAEFKTTINTSIFTKGYSPEFVEINITGKDINGQAFTESELKDSVIFVNKKPITNYKVEGTSIKLNKDYLDTLDPGEYEINVLNKDIDLNELTGFKIVDTQAELTPIIESGDSSFKTGNALNDIVVKLNAKDDNGKDCEFDNIEGIYYEGTKMPSTMYKFENGKLVLSTKLLNLLSCGDKEIIIRSKIKDTAKIIEGKLNVKVLSGAELKFMLRETGKDKFIVGSSGDLTYDVVQTDENNKNVDRSKIDISNVKLEKGGYTLTKGVDYYIDNINKVITLKKDYLNGLIAGETAIAASLGDLSRDIIVNVQEGEVHISATIQEDKLLKYKYGLAESDMNIALTGIAANNVVRVGIRTKEGTITYIDKNTHYTIVGSDKVKINQSYLNSLSAATSPYTVVISDANRTAEVTFEVLSIARFKFDTGVSEKDFNISSLTADLTAKILEENCDGKDIDTDLTNITLRLNNEGKELSIAPSDYEITGDIITIKKEFLEKLPGGTTEVEVYKEGIVTPAKFMLKK